ncbi:(acyl-carrier-protein) S-malonyltransferase [Gammaproteobacteria bacterium]
MNGAHDFIRPNLGFIFPGQGSQSIGMLRELAQSFPLVIETYAEASDILGYDLWGLVQDGEEATLNHTERTQPAMLAAGVAVWRVWRAQGGDLPAVMAGHSLGEYTALVCAEALDFAPAVSLVADRGRYMRDAVPEGEGAMAAILGLNDAQIIAACMAAAEGEVVTAVNFNAPGQVVIAGNHAAVIRAVEVAKGLGARRAVLLPVSVPSHCALMVDAARRLRERLETVPLTSPRIPVLNNVDVATPTDPAMICDALVRQLYSPVRWVECVQNFARRGISTLIEAGPGKVLAGLCKRIEKGVVTRPVFDPDGLHQSLDPYPN